MELANQILLILIFINIRHTFNSIYAKGIRENSTNQDTDKPHFVTLTNLYREVTIKLKNVLSSSGISSVLCGPRLFSR